MAYTVNFTDGTIAAVVADGTTDTTFSISLVGKNATTYGEVFAENFIKLLENGANTTVPGNPIEGELWFNKSGSSIGNIGPNSLGVYDGTTFKPLGGSTALAVEPASPAVGDLWFDTANDQLNVYSGASFILVGPAHAEPDGVSGAVVELVNGLPVVKLYVSDGTAGSTPVVSNLVATISQTDITPSPTITGFPVIKAGITLNDTIGALRFKGTATDSELLDGIDSTSFVRNDMLLETMLELTISGDLDVAGDTTVADFAVGTSSTVTMGGAVIQNVGTPVASTDAATKADVDAVSSGSTSGLALKVDIAGDTMTGSLILSGSPTIGLHATTKDYVDTSITSGVSSGITGKVDIAGDTMTGSLILDADPTIALGAATKDYVDTTVASATPASTSNAFGTRTVSTSPPVGTGSNGDIHYQI